jgi:diketogulonate reductase-like aldo/keto reductase
MSTPTVRLHNGVEMPRLILGVCQLLSQPGLDSTVHPTFVGMLPERAHRQVQMALDAGMHAFDTAFIYRTQPAIGAVLCNAWRQGLQPSRQQVWITSKVHHPDATAACFGCSHMPDWHNMTPDEIAIETQKHFEQSLNELGMGYVDLMLLHWPGSPNMGNPEINRQRRLAAWRVLERAYERGWARAIGVSNFSPTHMDQLKADGARVVPMVNQFEASVTLQYTEILEYCKQNQIVPQAYSPLGRNLTEIPDAVHRLAKARGRDIGQVIVRYLMQLGYSVVVMTNTETRMKSNQQVFDFELSEEEMDQLKQLARPQGGWGLPSPMDIE